MAQIGTIEYEAKVTGVGEAKQNANDLAESQRDVAAASEESAAATGFLAGSIGELGDEHEETGEETDRMNTKTDLLSSSLWFLGSAAVSTTASMLGLSGAFTTATGAASALGSAVSGISVGTIVGGGLTAGTILGGTAAGLAVGLSGVKLMQELGIMQAVRDGASDIGSMLPDWIVDGWLQVMSIGAGPLAVLGGFISGFLDDIFKQSLPKSFEQGIGRAKQVGETFVGAWERQIGRAETAWTDFTGFLETKFDEGIGWVLGKIDNLERRVDSLTSSIPGTADPGTGAASEGAIGVGGFPFDVPFLQGGGRILEGGIARVHKGETVVPAGGGGGVTIEDISVTIEAGDFDPSDMSRHNAESLAEEIAELVGRETSRRAGVR